jgi:lipopolysaccharide/colanic/teichoic acid biosynthesis glycosyltransferase
MGLDTSIRQHPLGTAAALRVAGGAAGRRAWQPESVALDLEWRVVRTPSRDGAYERFVKRGIDVVAAVVGLVVCAPVLAAACLLIWLDSGFPLLFRQRRVGRGGKLFVFYKLRTMHRDAERVLAVLRPFNEVAGPAFKMSNDPRITRIGRWLRRLSLDELPQLWNVLRGDMSLVGPRPPLPSEVQEYEDWQLGRLAVRPGLTCFWQVRGRSLIGFEDWIRMDLEYVASRGPWTDLRILLATVPAVLSRRGAY